MVKRIQNMGYSAIRSGSINAGCGYICVPDASQIEILGTV
jgi:hypothetical protein